MITAKTPKEQQALDEMKKVIDPDSGFSLYDMGLLYDLQVDDDIAYVKMTLTSMACPVAGKLKEDIEHACMMVEGIGHAFAEIVWVPRWDPGTMASEDVKYEMGIFD